MVFLFLQEKSEISGDAGEDSNVQGANVNEMELEQSNVKKDDGQIEGAGDSVKTETGSEQKPAQASATGSPVR